LYTRRGKIHLALVDCDTALRVNAQDTAMLYQRAFLHHSARAHAKSLTDLNALVGLDPGHFWGRGLRAWILATAPDERLRNGPQALADARHGCELTGWKDPYLLQALAAAHAECGQFEDAIKRQEQAVELAPAESRDAYRGLVQLYRTGQPYREALP
jgi:tetratricopeptide (TPR) repeat protein